MVDGRYQSINPSNARIFIDYNNEKEPVRFEYITPDKYRLVVFSTLFSIWIYFNILLMYLAMPFILIYGIYHMTTTTDVVGLSFKEMLWQFLSQPTTAVALGFTLYFLAPPTIGTIIFLLNKKLLAKFPIINFKFHSLTTKAYMAEYTSVPENNIIEIPMFRNIMLDYEAKGEFAHYLKKVEVTEHPFKLGRIRGLFFGKRKYVRNEWLWKAKFIFEKNPKKGYIKMWFI